MTGRLITLEGGEGAGKSTAMAHLAARIEARGVELVQVREPGGTEIGEAIRQVLLDPSHAGLCAEAELLLMFASRAQLVRETIRPALARGAFVLTIVSPTPALRIRAGVAALMPAVLPNWNAGPAASSRI